MIDVITGLFILQFVFPSFRGVAALCGRGVYLSWPDGLFSFDNKRNKIAG